MWTKRVAAAVAFSLIAGILAISGSSSTASAQEAAPPSRVVHFVVDVSGSMSTNNRLESAKSAISALVPTLGADTWAGLRTFGVSGCDTRLDVGPGPLDVPTFLDAVAPLRPSGLTPLAAGLSAAAADLSSVPAASKTVILLADGDNNCGGDPCQVARDIAASGTELVVHTAGLQVGGSARSALECIATATGGTYVDVQDPSDLGGLLGGVIGRQLRYVALGDSYSSGEGAGAGNYFQWYLTQYRCESPIRGVVTTSPVAIRGRNCEPFQTGFDIGCHRAPTAWSFALARRSGQIKDDVENAACTGATIDKNLLNKWKDNEQPQVDRLRELNAQEQVDLVTFTIGGNDVGFGAMGRACFVGNGPAYTCRAAERGVKRKLAGIDLVEPIRRLHQAAPDATIALVSYPQVVPDNDAAVTRCRWLDPVERESLRSVVGEINLAQYFAVEQAKREGIRAVFVDITDALKGNEVCTDNSHVVPVYGNPTNSEQAHPDSVDRSATGGTSGQQDLANAVYDGLRSLGVITG